ncbi:MAG: nucleoside monophosphate kinase [Candidatus Buchananbacteria bacterium]
MADKTKFQAILLVGPTGAGKTPLGQVFEEKGLDGRRCFHFDFGAQLRGVAEAGSRQNVLNSYDVGVVRQVLHSGALLTPGQFPIAKAILCDFMANKGVTDNDVIILNGLPRDVRQAIIVSRILTVKSIIFLRCSPLTIVARISSNLAGDRTGRIDDGIECVTQRLKIFFEKTAPLLGHYQQQGVSVTTLPVEFETSSMDLWQLLNDSPMTLF